IIGEWNRVMPVMTVGSANKQSDRRRPVSSREYIQDCVICPFNVIIRCSAGNRLKHVGTSFACEQTNFVLGGSGKNTSYSRCNTMHDGSSAALRGSNGVNVVHFHVYRANNVLNGRLDASKLSLFPTIG